jgi:glutamine amidotransferase
LIVVLDYGMGNLRSVQKAIEHLGFTCRVQTDLAGASKLVIPGVGAFGAAMDRIGRLRDDIQGFAGPILGICLGQQLLFDKSLEHGEHEGLGLVRGEVKYLEPSPGNKVPNIGWAPVESRPGSLLFRGVEPGSHYYFVHSLYTCATDAEDVAATSMHTQPFAAAIERGNVFATQFHPEKSGIAGLRVLENFLKC